MTTDMAIIDEARTHAAGAKGIVVHLADLEVDTADDIEQAKSILDDVQDRSKKLDKRLKEITKPMNDALKSVRDLFRPALQSFAQAEALLKTKIGKAKVAIEQRRFDAAKATQLALAAGQHMTAATIEIERPAQDVAGLQYRELWDFELVDSEMVPRAFLVVDEKMVRAFVQAHKERAKIPGLRIFKKTVVVSR